MIDTNWIASLCGVALGSGFTWFVQRNEWGRQRRWELKRDAALDALRCLADLKNAITELDSSYAVPLERFTDDVKAAQVSKQRDAREQLGKCCSAYERAQIVADLTTGGKLSRDLSAYFQIAIPIVVKAMPSRRRFLDNADTKKALALRGNVVTMSAREALGIKGAGDLPLLDEQN